jgi:hypothetical protein
MDIGQNGATPLKSRDYEVGRGKPPRAHQFKPGQCGNPKGRRKGSKNQKTNLRETLNRKLTLREGGKARKVTVREALFIRLAEDSLKGNVKSMALLLNLDREMLAGEAGPIAVGEDDRDIVKNFLARVRATQPKEN